MTALIGQSLGRYHILEQLGEGGMAVVYKAFDTRLERNVAIKVILPQKQHTEKFIKRFEREAKALAGLSHPNIVKVLDYGEYEGIPFLVMEYLHGGTLKQRFMGKPMPWQDAIRIVTRIARALDYAHQHKIVHRDIKPSNILITDSDEPMLSDFGIAKMLEAEETLDLTGTGVGVGTPEYMSPEQAQGQQIDARSDLYSLGVVLYEMVTGRKPYQADTPYAVAIKQVNEPLPRPSQYLKGLPEAVEHFLLKALAKNPLDRYDDSTFAATLEKLVRGEFPREKSIIAKRSVWFRVAFFVLAIALIVVASVWSFPNLMRKSLPSPPPPILPTPSVIPMTQTPVPFYAWEFNQAGSLEDWGQMDWCVHDMRFPDVKDGILSTETSGNDPYICSIDTLSIDAAAAKHIEIRMRVSSGRDAQIYFATIKQPEMSESTSKPFVVRPGDEYFTYVIDMKYVSTWEGTVTQLRLDPTGDVIGASIAIDYIRVIP